MPGDLLLPRGVFDVRYFDILGRLVWHEPACNTVVTVGKNLLLDSGLAGSAYTVTGPYCGLISGASFTATASTDTMASHAGWLEAGSANAPTYSGTRATVSWSAASGGAKSFATAASFTFTGNGTVEGVFITYGSGAVSTIGSTAGTLFSAGVFTGGSQAVSTSGNLQASYTISI